MSHAFRTKAAVLFNYVAFAGPPRARTFFGRTPYKHTHSLYTLGRPTRLCSSTYTDGYVRVYTRIPTTLRIAPGSACIRIYLRRCIFRTEITMRDAPTWCFFLYCRFTDDRPQCRRSTRTDVENGGAVLERITIAIGLGAPKTRVAPPYLPAAAAAC